MKVILSKIINKKENEMTEFSLDDFSHMLIDFIAIQEKIVKGKAGGGGELDDYISQLLGEEDYAEGLKKLIEEYSATKKNAFNPHSNHKVIFTEEREA
jgi:hypothetical protein